VHHSVCGFGPLQPFFEDDSIEEICFCEYGLARSEDRTLRSF